MGAEEFGFATAPLVVSGCVMMRVCHLNTCPVGIATQDPELRKKFTGQPEFVEHFFRFIAQEVREYMAQLGFRTMDEMIGRVDRLNVRPALNHWKARGLDFSAILGGTRDEGSSPRRCVTHQDHGLDRALDRELIEACAEALEARRPVSITRQVRNVHRTVGTMLGSEVTRRWGGKGLPDGTINIECQGSAGQSFGAFIPAGMTLTLEGDANDYVGKGLSGGRIVIFPPKESTFAAEDNIIIGNVALYGATSGEAFIRGVAGERFAVRNSGAVAVVEGVGDHGCEYMTGGRVVILGRTGRNFAAGMSGGLAYVLDEAGIFAHRCNHDAIDLEPLFEDDDVKVVRHLLERHVQYTGSAVAARLLEDWALSVEQFVKVIPREYKKAVEAARAKEAAGKRTTLLQVANG
jgi:glutamate synthase (ferredoxin)